jgi:hypothetical protein
MGDSHSEDPPDGGIMQRVMTGISAFGSGRRQPPPAAARRRSASITPSVTIRNNNISSSSSFGLSASRPDPDAPRADNLRARHVLTDEDSFLPPNVEARRGSYGGSFSILASISNSLQRQVRQFEEEFEAVIDEDPPHHHSTPRRHITIPDQLLNIQAQLEGLGIDPSDRDEDLANNNARTPSVDHGRQEDIYDIDSDNETFFDTEDPPPDVIDDDSHQEPTPTPSSSSRSFLGRLFPSPPALSSVPVVTPSYGHHPSGLSIGTPVAHASHRLSGSSTSALPLPSVPLWYNTGAAVNRHRILKTTFASCDTTSPVDHLNGVTRSFTFRIVSSHPQVVWALQVGTQYDLLHNLKGDLRSSTSCQPPRLILIGHCRESHTLVFNIFPLLLCGNDPHHVVVVHPFLHGYHGSEDHGLSTRQGMYAIPVSWGGQQLTTSYAVGWGLWADFKYRAQHMPHVLTGCSGNCKPSPQRTRRAATLYNQECLRGHPPYGRFRPEIPRYILQQLAFFGIPDLMGKTSLRDLPEAERGTRLRGDFFLRQSQEVPETDTPSQSGSATESTTVSTPDQHNLEGSDYAKTRTRVVDRFVKEPKYKIPSDHAAYPRWELLFRSALLDNAWKSGGTHILDHPVTTEQNRVVSAALANALFVCSTHSSEQLQNDYFLRGQGNTLLKEQKGCELFHLLDVAYRPTGAKWLWIWDAKWYSIRHEQSETIASLRGRLEELASKLLECGIFIPPKTMVFRLLTLACSGPYYDVFAHIKDKICVTEDPAWDLNDFDLDIMTARLTSALMLSSYYGTNSLLKKGKYPTVDSSSGPSRLPGGGDDESNDPSGYKDWMGSKNLTQAQALATLTVFQCVICKKNDHSHLDGHCPVLKKHQLILTKSSGSHRNRQGQPTKDPSGGGASKEPPTATVPDSKPSPSALRFGPGVKPPVLPSTGVAKPPVSAPVDPSKTVLGRQADAPSIDSASTPPSLPDPDASDTDNDPDWNMPNEEAVAAQEASRVRANLADARYHQANAATATRSPVGDPFSRVEAEYHARLARRGGRGGRGRGGGGGHVSVTNSLIQAINTPASSAWTPVRGRARKAKSTVSSYLCADSGASRDLFTQRDWFIEYTDISARQEYVIVADDTRVPIMGVGSVRFNLGGHEVLLRRVYHVPGLNGSLLSIRTHRRRGAGCIFLADQDGCHLTFPSFVLDIDDTHDVLIECGPSTGGPLEYEQPHSSIKRRLEHDRNRALRSHIQCCRSRLNTTAPHLLRPLPVNAKTDLDDTLEAVLPTHYVPETSCAAESRYSTAELHRLFGCRKFDYGILPYLGDGLHVTTDREPPLTIGDTVNINRGARGGPVPKPPRARHTIGADIGYGEGIGPGGFKYCLFLVDLATRYTWVYGLSDLSGDCIVDALWRFFVDAGGFPKRFRCDFDRRFLHGKVGRLLRSHGVKIGASPPYRHSQNGAVERNWNTAVEMGRSFLAEANLPKRYWFWAVREASIRMNMLPVKSGPATDDAMEFQGDPEPDINQPVSANLASSPSSITPPPPRSGKPRKTRAKTAEGKARQWSTPMELFYGVKPDYRVLFRFGSIGYFRRTTESSGKEKSKFSSKSHTGIALGRSDYTNGMMFWDPTTSSFSVLADFRLDPDRGLGDPFPGIHYDGGMAPSLISGDTAPREPYPPGSPVFAIVGDDIYEGNVVAVPTPNCQWYTILPIGGTAETFNVPPCDLCSPDDPMLPLDCNLDRSSELPSLPPWMKQDSQLTLESDGASRQGYLSLSVHGTWEFVQRDGHGAVTYFIDLSDLPHTWRSRLLDGSLWLGWGALSRAYHVHAQGLRRGVPGSFKLSMRKDYVDHPIWMDSYTEEYVSLRDQTTFFTLTWEEYERKYSHVKIIPSMNVQTIKKDEEGVPVRAKSRIVALGNHEDTLWEPGDVHAPVIWKESDRLLTTIAVNMGRTQKQGDCKNAFLHPTLPPDETVIVRPPPGCPFSQPGELWLLNKTLYGLRRSPKHWYDALCGALREIGMTPMAHDPCVFTGSMFEGGPLLYLGVYVDDFTYFSESDEVERIFEAALSSKLQIDWMGEVGWFLGKGYEWEHLPDGRLCVTITQTAKIEAMLEDLHMSDCNPVKSPYRLGLVIDSIPHDGAPPESKLDIVKPYQRAIGGLNWLATSTRPDLSVCVSLLSQFSHNPSEGHLDAVKHVLRYLKGTRDHGIRYIQDSCFADTLLTDWTDRPPRTPECVAFTDANWGPQDASHPPTDRVIHISKESVRSLLGHVLIRCGGPVAWGCMREPKSSRSSCEAEIYAMDEGTKTVDMLRNIMEDLALPDVSHPTPLYNDNQGSVDWSRGASLSKRLRHMNIREVGVRDSIRLQRTHVHHIPGVHNVADIFTKEHKSSVTLCAKITWNVTFRATFLPGLQKIST